MLAIYISLVSAVHYTILLIFDTRTNREYENSIGLCPYYYIILSWFNYFC